jgi:hypothetical protein
MEPRFLFSYPVIDFHSLPILIFFSLSSYNFSCHLHSLPSLPPFLLFFPQPLLFSIHILLPFFRLCSSSSSTSFSHLTSPFLFPFFNFHFFFFPLPSLLNFLSSFSFSLPPLFFNFPAAFLFLCYLTSSYPFLFLCTPTPSSPFVFLYFNFLFPFTLPIFHLSLILSSSFGLQLPFLFFQYLSSILLQIPPLFSFSFYSFSSCLVPRNCVSRISGVVDIIRNDT